MLAGPGSMPCPRSGCGSIVLFYSCDRASITACRPYRSVRSVVATMPSKVSRERKIGRKEQEGGCHVRDRGCVVFSVRPGFFCIMREPRYRSSHDAVSLYLCIRRGRISIALLWNGDRLEPREGLCQGVKTQVSPFCMQERLAPLVNPELGRQSHFFAVRQSVSCRVPTCCVCAPPVRASLSNLAEVLDYPVLSMNPDKRIRDMLPLPCCITKHHVFFGKKEAGETILRHI